MTNHSKVDWRIRMFGYYQPRFEQLMPDVERKWEFDLVARAIIAVQYGIEPIDYSNNSQQTDVNQATLF